MTTLGSINSQNRVANYSANYRGSLSLSLPSRSSAPVIHRVHRLSSLSADYLSPRLIADKIRPSGFFSLPPLPLHMPGILSRAFDRIRYRWNAEFAKTSIENTSDRGAPCRCTRFRAACRNCLVRDRTTYTQPSPIGTGKRVVGQQGFDRISSRFAREMDGNSKSESAACTSSFLPVSSPLPLFFLSLFFLRFIFTLTGKEDKEAEGNGICRDKNAQWNVEWSDELMILVRWHGSSLLRYFRYTTVTVTERKRERG